MDGGSLDLAIVGTTDLSLDIEAGLRIAIVLLVRHILVDTGRGKLRREGQGTTSLEVLGRISTRASEVLLDGDVEGLALLPVGPVRRLELEGGVLVDGAVLGRADELAVVANVGRLPGGRGHALASAGHGLLDDGVDEGEGDVGLGEAVGGGHLVDLVAVVDVGEVPAGHLEGVLLAGRSRRRRSSAARAGGGGDGGAKKSSGYNGEHFEEVEE